MKNRTYASIGVHQVLRIVPQPFVPFIFGLATWVDQQPLCNEPLQGLLTQLPLPHLVVEIVSGPIVVYTSVLERAHRVLVVFAEGAHVAAENPDHDRVPEVFTQIDVPARVSWMQSFGQSERACGVVEGVDAVTVLVRKPATALAAGRLHERRTRTYVNVYAEVVQEPLPAHVGAHRQQVRCVFPQDVVQFNLP